MNNKTEKPATPRTDVTVGYVLSVDRKLKTQFELSGDAMAAALRLQQAYPVLQVEVFDATARRYTTGGGTRELDEFAPSWRNAPCNELEVGFFEIPSNYDALCTLPIGP